MRVIRGSVAVIFDVDSKADVRLVADKLATVVAEMQLDNDPDVDVRNVRTSILSVRAIDVPDPDEEE